MDAHSLSASGRCFSEHFLKGTTMKGVLTPEWVNNQVFVLVLNEQCLAVFSQKNIVYFFQQKFPSQKMSIVFCQ